MPKIISQIIIRMEKKTPQLAFTQQRVCVPISCNMYHQTLSYIFYTHACFFSSVSVIFSAVATKHQGLMVRKGQGTTKKNKSMFSNVYNTIRSVLIYNSVVWSPILLTHRSSAGTIKTVYNSFLKFFAFKCGVQRQQHSSHSPFITHNNFRNFSSQKNQIRFFF